MKHPAQACKEGLNIVEDMIPGASTPFDKDEEAPLYPAFQSILRRYNQVVPAFGGQGFRGEAHVGSGEAEKKGNCTYAAAQWTNKYAKWYSVPSGTQLAMPGKATLETKKNKVNPKGTKESNAINHFTLGGLDRNM